MENKKFSILDWERKVNTNSATWVNLQSNYRVRSLKAVTGSYLVFDGENRPLGSHRTIPAALEAAHNHYIGKGNV